MNFIKKNIQPKNNYRFNGIFLFFYLTIILFTLTCTGLSREDFLDGEFGVVDSTPPEILTPINDSKVTGIANSQVNLAWTAKIGAIRYTVEIVKDDGSENPFSDSSNDIVEGNPFKISEPETSVKITLPDAWSYKWRVRANITEEEQYGDGNFHALDDAVYILSSIGNNLF